MDTQYFYIENPTYRSGDRVFCVLYELQVALMIIPYPQSGFMLSVLTYSSSINLVFDFFSFFICSLSISVILGVGVGIFSGKVPPTL